MTASAMTEQIYGTSLFGDFGPSLNQGVSRNITLHEIPKCSSLDAAACGSLACNSCVVSDRRRTSVLYTQLTLLPRPELVDHIRG